MGKISAPPDFGALGTVAGTPVLVIHSGDTKQSFGMYTGNTKSLSGVHKIHMNVIV